jgi:tetratricopeptide (TPR) repeat protein
MTRAPREALEMAKALFWFWQARGHGGEGLAWLEAALARPENAAADTLRQAALLGAGSLSWMIARYDAAAAQLAESAAIAERSGDERGRAFALAILGHDLVFADRPAEARQYLDLAVAVARRAGDPFTLARALGSQADGARHEGRDADAVRAADEALAIFRSIGMVEGQAFNHVYRAAGLRRHDAAAARAALHEAVELFARVELPYGLYVALLCLADLASPKGESAARVLGALDGLAEAGGSRGSFLERRMLARLESAVGPGAHDAARAAGRALSRAELVTFALSL